MTLHVKPSRDGVTGERCCQPMLEAAQSALAEAESLHGLPDDYIDVTEGWLAPLKRGIKRKLLNNFKKAYVDVVSRQQSAFNRRILTALAELTECCATLDHVRSLAGESAKQTAVPNSQLVAALVDRKLPAGGAKDLTALVESLAELLSESEERCTRLEERLARLESRTIGEEVAS